MYKFTKIVLVLIKCSRMSFPIIRFRSGNKCRKCRKWIIFPVTRSQLDHQTRDPENLNFWKLSGWVFQDLPIRGNTRIYLISTAWHVCIHFGFRTPAKDYWQNCIQTERIEFITALFRSKDPAIRWTACNGRSEGFEVLIRSTSLKQKRPNESLSTQNLAIVPKK